MCERSGGRPTRPLCCVQVCDRPQVLILMFGNSFSIAFFNYFGVSITKSSSASYRMVKHVHSRFPRRL